MLGSNKILKSMSIVGLAFSIGFSSPTQAVLGIGMGHCEPCMGVPAILTGVAGLGGMAVSVPLGLIFGVAMPVTAPVGVAITAGSGLLLAAEAPEFGQVQRLTQEIIEQRKISAEQAEIYDSELPYLDAIAKSVQEAFLEGDVKQGEEIWLDAKKDLSDDTVQILEKEDQHIRGILRAQMRE
jgi:hypothetical protein